MTQDGRLETRDMSPDDSSAFEFYLVPIKGRPSMIAIKSRATGKFVSVCENEGNILKANGPKVDDWEVGEIRQQ